MVGEYLLVALSAVFLLVVVLVIAAHLYVMRQFSGRFVSTYGVSYRFRKTPTILQGLLSLFDPRRVDVIPASKLDAYQNSVENISCECPFRVTGQHLKQYFSSLQCYPDGTPQTERGPPPKSSQRPITAAYLHLAAFPAHFAVLGSPEFPIKVLGAVHASNSITLRGHPPPLTSDDDYLDLHVHAVIPTRSMRYTAKGDFAFDIHTTIMPLADGAKPHTRRALLHLAAAPPMVPSPTNAFSGLESPVDMFEMTATTDDDVIDTLYKDDLPPVVNVAKPPLPSEVAVATISARQAGAMGWVWRETATFVIPSKNRQLGRPQPSTAQTAAPRKQLTRGESLSGVQQPIADPVSGEILFDITAGRRTLEARWNYPGSLSRVFAKVCGDYNPIHLWPLTARLFGLRSNVAHGMYSVARAAHAISDGVSACSYLPPLAPLATEAGADEKPRCASGEVVLRCAFVRPLFLPAPAVDLIARAAHVEANARARSLSPQPGGLWGTDATAGGLRRCGWMFSVGAASTEGKPSVVGTLSTLSHPDCGGAVDKDRRAPLPTARLAADADNTHRSPVEPARPV